VINEPYWREVGRKEDRVKVMDKWDGVDERRDRVPYIHCTAIIDCVVINGYKKNIQLLKRTFQIRERPLFRPLIFFLLKQ
jgi:hypothetical protein